MSGTIAVLGAGAIGGCVGADLTEAGYDVTIVDQWPANVEAMKAGGLHIATAEGGLHTPVRACHLCDLAALDKVFDIALLTVKSYDTRWMVEIIQDHLKGRLSEIEFINGLVMRKGREAGIATPYNDAVVTMDREIGRGLRKMDPTNLDRLRARLNLA